MREAEQIIAEDGELVRGGDPDLNWSSDNNALMYCTWYR